MSTSPSDPPASILGRRLVEQARRLGIHPNTLIRHIRKGKKLSDGSIVRPRATVTPGGFYLRDEDLDQFFAILTRDKNGESASVLPSLAAADNSHQVADAALAAAGW
jgi:hypothetical protein